MTLRFSRTMFLSNLLFFQPVILFLPCFPFRIGNIKIEARGERGFRSDQTKAEPELLVTRKTATPIITVKFLIQKVEVLFNKGERAFY